VESNFKVGDKVRVKSSILRSYEKKTQRAFSGTSKIVAIGGGIVELKNDDGNYLNTSVGNIYLA
jgi:shikimate kinase